MLPSTHHPICPSGNHFGMLVAAGPATAFTWLAPASGGREAPDPFHTVNKTARTDLVLSP